MQAPLDGVRVIDFGEVMQAPYCTQVLGDLGADVIKIERPAGDLIRALDRPSVHDGGESCYFVALNRNKRSARLDLRDESHRSSIEALIDEADVLVHSFRPGVMERLGLDYETVSARNPRIIYAVATAYGEEGPWATLPGQDMLAQSVSGVLMKRRRGDGAPRLEPTPAIDFASGNILAQGILAALLERNRSGLGQKVSVSLLATALAMQGPDASSEIQRNYQTNWAIQGFPNEVFRTADGWITVLGLFRENPLQLLCSALDIADLSAEEKYASYDLQIENRQELNDLVRPEFAVRTTDELMGALSGQDLLCAPALTFDEAIHSEQAKRLDMLIDVHTSQGPPTPVVGNPLKLSRTPPQVYRRVPGLGEHTADALQGMFDTGTSDVSGT